MSEIYEIEDTIFDKIKVYETKLHNLIIESADKNIDSKAEQNYYIGAINALKFVLENKKEN